MQRERVERLPNERLRHDQLRRVRTSAPAKNYPYAYIDRKESAPYWNFAKQYTLADEMFFDETASSFIAHQMIISGTVQYSKDAVLTDQPNNNPWGCDAPGPRSGARSDYLDAAALLERESISTTVHFRASISTAR